MSPHPAATVTILVGGQHVPMQPIDGRIQHTLVLDPGAHTVVVRAQDGPREARAEAAAHVVAEAVLDDPSQQSPMPLALLLVALWSGRRLRRGCRHPHLHGGNAPKSDP